MSLPRTMNPQPNGSSIRAVAFAAMILPNLIPPSLFWQASARPFSSLCPPLNLKLERNT